MPNWILNCLTNMNLQNITRNAEKRVLHVSETPVE